MTPRPVDVGKAGSGTQREAGRLLRWLLVPILGLLAILSAVQYEQGWVDAESALQRRADERAQELLALARPATAHVHDLRRLLEAAWDDPPSAPAELRAALRAWRPADAPAGTPADGWTLDDAPDELRQRWGQLWWGSDKGEAPSEPWLRRFALVQRAARAASERSPGFEGSYFVSVDRNISWSYPWFDTPQMLKAMDVKSLRELDGERIRSFIGAEDRLTAEARARGWWGQPYVSQVHGRLVQSHVSPVIASGRYQGEVSVDFRLDTLQEAAQLWRGETHLLWVLDRQLRVVVDAHNPLQAPGDRGIANQLVEVPLAQRLPPGVGAPLMPRLNRPDAVSLTHLPGWVVLSAARAESPWIYLQMVPTSTLRSGVLLTLLPNGFIGLALLVVFVWGQWLFTRWFVNPALGVLAYLRELSANPSAPAPDLGRRWEGWVRAVNETVQAQHRQREQIDLQRDALRRSERLSTMGTMLASVAHELNNPLAIAMGRAGLLEERVLAATDAASPAAWAVRDDARRVREAAERCARIVTNFLNFARQRPPVRRPVQLAQVVEQATELLGHRLRSQGIRLALAIRSDLPVVKADPDQLVQVLLNLMLNAQQAMEGQTRERVISLSAGRERRIRPQDSSAGWVWVRVMDTGPGIPQGQQERLFEPFFTTKEAGQGTGLGLSISQSLVQEHGGDLRLESSSSQGSCFRLTLPVLPDEVLAAQDTVAIAAAQTELTDAPLGATGSPVAGTDNLALARVLVIDDDAEMAELVMATLENEGYDVAIAESGSVALELLAEASFDVVVSGVHVPDLPAARLQLALAERWTALYDRTLFITGDALSPVVQTELQGLARPWLEKPFARGDLLKAVAMLTPASPAHP